MTIPVISTPAPFYIAGGTLRSDAQSYVRRRADDDLYEGLLRGEFCYILTPRQMGKSSLMVRVSARLQDAQVAVAVLDLTAVGQNVTPEQWYGGLVVQLGYRLGQATEVMSFWQTESVLGPLQRWMKTIRDVILPRSSQRIVVFIDEIDAVRSLPFSADEFFAGIRECYNRRSQNPEMARLTFGLLGVAAPTDLIRDTRMTPFNIGRRIELHDFTPSEAAPLARGLTDGRGSGDAVLNRILHWTGGHPYLTQRMCLKITQETGPHRCEDVDNLCADLFFSHRAQERDDNLLFVRERMLRSDVDQGSLFDVYRRIRKGSTVADDEMNPLVSTLRLSGIVRAVDGKLKVRNRIYSRVFDRTWIDAVMPQAELRRQRLAYRRGILRAALIATVIIAVVSVFALVAFKERRRAEQEVASNLRLLYDTRMRLAQETWDHAYVDRVEELLKATEPLPGQEDLRGFEWYLFRQLVQGDVWRSGEPYRVVASTLSANGKLLYIAEFQQEANQENTLLLKVYDLGAQKELRRFSVPTDAAFPQVLFSADRERAILTGPNKTIEQWDLRTGTQGAVFAGHKDSLSTIALSDDGNTLASGDLSKIIRVWDVRNKREIQTFANRSNWPRSVALSPDGKLLAVATDSLQVSLWETHTGRKVEPLLSQQGTVDGVKFSPDGHRLLMAIKNGALQFWDVRHKRLLAPLSGHKGQIQSAAFSPDGKVLATGSADRTVRLWSVSNGNELQTIRGHGAAVYSVSFSRDGYYLVTGGFDGSVKIWDIANNTGSLQLPEGVQGYLTTTFSAANKAIAFGTTTNNEAKLWNLTTRKEITQLDEPADNLMCAAFSADGTLLATGGLGNQIKIWESVTGRSIKVLKGHTDRIFAVSFSPTGELLVSGGNDRTLRLWDLVSGKEEAQLKSDLDNSYLAVFSPSGDQIASGTREGTVQLWDVPSRRVVRTFRGHTGQVRAIAFSGDDKWLATGADDHTLRLWDVASGRLLRTLGLADTVQRATFSPDGRRLVTGGGDGAIRLWDISSGQELMSLPGHTDAVTSIMFSNDGKSLVTAGADGVIRLWTAARDASPAFLHRR